MPNIFLNTARTVAATSNPQTNIQKIANKKWGTIISLLAVASWNWVIPMGVMGLWTTMGNMRMYVTGVCIIIAFVIYFVQKRKTKLNKDENVEKNTKAEVKI